MKKNTLLIGAGNMGSALGKALLETKHIAPEHFFVADNSSEKLQFFHNKNCHTSQHTEDFLEQANVIFLATKPQGIRDLLETWKTKKLFSPHQIIISIAAGVCVSELQKFSGVQKIVRVMPNTPLLVGKGVSGYFFSPEISEAEKNEIRTMMKCFGLAIECETEEKINAITALSGSGPAYFFRLLESMSEQAEQFGFSKYESEQISLHTLMGAGFLAENARNNTCDNFITLREKITSKGGTTQAALESFEQSNLSEIFQRGICAAKKRAEEL